MKTWSDHLAIAALVLAGLVTLHELTWLHRTPLAKVLVALGASVVLLALSVLVGRSEEGDGGET